LNPLFSRVFRFLKNIQKVAFNIQKVAFNIQKVAFNIQKVAFNIQKVAFGHLDATVLKVSSLRKTFKTIKTFITFTTTRRVLKKKISVLTKYSYLKLTHVNQLEF
jgi:hypothetical protein